MVSRARAAGRPAPPELCPLRVDIITKACTRGFDGTVFAAADEGKGVPDERCPCSGVLNYFYHFWDDLVPHAAMLSLVAGLVPIRHCTQSATSHARRERERERERERKKRERER